MIAAGGRCGAAALAVIALVGAGETGGDGEREREGGDRGEDADATAGIHGIARLLSRHRDDRR
jgi:hypothetical protein